MAEVLLDETGELLDEMGDDYIFLHQALHTVEIYTLVTSKKSSTLNMEHYKHLIRWMNDLNNSDIGIIFSFFGLMAGMYTALKFALKYYSKHADPVKAYGLLAVLVFLGLIFPLLILLSTDWIGWKHILLNLVGICSILNFFMLGFIIYTMNSVKSQP